MAETLRPGTAVELQEIVRGALADEVPLEVLGLGSKRDFGRPVEARYQVALARLSGITLYEPGELVLSAGAGTPLTEIRAALADNHQELAFEPPDLGPLFGGEAGDGTLGGLVATNLAGPKRIKSGAARDHVLGFTAITGRGDLIKSGGRVVKNVTGYDLSKLITGSFGTLGAMSEVTIKVLPAAETERTLLLGGVARGEVFARLRAALGSVYDVSAAAWLPDTVAERAGLSGGSGAIRIEGPQPSVAYRAEALKTLLAPGGGEVHELDATASRTLWQKIRDLAPLLGEVAQVIKVSIPPAAAEEVWSRLEEAGVARGYADWAGGLSWLGLEDSEPTAIERVRGAIATHGGHATLIKASREVRRSVPVFQPQPEALARLSARIKDAFDPKRILNPGRMYADV